NDLRGTDWPGRLRRGETSHATRDSSSCGCRHDRRHGGAAIGTGHHDGTLCGSLSHLGAGRSARERRVAADPGDRGRVTDDRRGPWESFSAVVKLAGFLVHNPFLALTVWAAGLLGSMLLFVRRTEGAEPKQWRFWLVVVQLSSSYSVIAIGAGYGHYLILLAPMYVLVAFAVMSRDSLNRHLRHAYFLVLAAGLLIALLPIASEYRDLTTRLLHDGHLRVGRAYELARILAAQSRAPVPMYLMEEHVVYWLTGNRPLTPMSTHPSNIAKRDILRVMRGPNATPIEELQLIFAQ